MALYVMSEDGFEEIEQTTLQAESIMERSGLQRRLKNNINLIAKALGEELLVLSEEFSGWDDSNRRIDLLCINKERDLVVIELKRTEHGGHMELQAIRYAAMVSPMEARQAIEVYQDTLEREQKSGASAESEILDWLGEDGNESFSLSGHVSIVLVAPNFSKEVTGTVIWLNEKFGMNIRCVRISTYKNNDAIILDVEQIIPLPEASDYITRLNRQRERSRLDHLEYSANRRSKYTEFWEGFLKFCADAEESKLFVRKKTIYKHYYRSEAFVGIRGLSLSCKALDRSVHVYLYIYYSPNAEENRTVFNRLREKEAQIHEKLGFELTWDAKEGRSAFIISADYVGEYVGVATSSDKWSVSYKWMLEITRKMATVFLDEV